MFFGCEEIKSISFIHHLNTVHFILMHPKFCQKSTNLSNFDSLQKCNIRIIYIIQYRCIRNVELYEGQIIECLLHLQEE